MIVQYPDTLKINTVGTSSFNSSTGNYTSGTAAAEVEQTCRAESSDGNGYITGSDGKRIDFGWIVYMPLSAPKIAIGSKVSVYKGAELILTDTVKRFSRGQLNCRVWL